MIGRGAILAVTALLLAAATAHAQGVPPITRSKEAATRAANAASNRVREQERVTAQTPARDSTRRAAPGRAGAAPNLAARTPGSSAGTAVDSVRPETGAPATELVLMREVFRYEDGGRRDPFLSLMETGELRPVVTDLRLVGVAYDPTGRRSLAMLKDVSTNEQYRVAVGNMLGRMRVTHIQPKQITLTIDEFGFSRQQVLILGDTTDTRTNR